MIALTRDISVTSSRSRGRQDQPDSMHTKGAPRGDSLSDSARLDATLNARGRTMASPKSSLPLHPQEERAAAMPLMLSASGGSQLPCPDRWRDEAR
jgi:hypothetical protein